MKKIAYLLDLLCILIFVAIGRHAHNHGESLKGIASTTWPFAVGLALGWFKIGATHRDILAKKSGGIIVLSTVIIGMILRVVAGQGTAFTFCIVALTFLSLFIIGWRAIAAKFMSK